MTDEDQCKVDELPSVEKYKRFKSRTECSGESEIGKKENEIEAELKTVLSQYESIKGLKDKIMGAWCYIFKGDSSSTEDNPLWNFFYFWLGEKVWGEVNNSSNSFSKIMSEIHKVLQEKLPGAKCGDMCTNNDQDKFNLMKKAYEYYMDHKYIQSNSEEYGPDGIHCNSECWQHIEKTACAYREVYKSCSGTTDSNEYCGKFKGMFEGYTEEKPLEEKCKIECSEAISTIATAPAIISSTIATLGLPTIVAFLLYKHNLLPSWFGNYFPNNKSGRKRTTATTEMGRHHFENDTFTENGDSTFDSTYDSTDTSTIGDDSTDGSIADRASTIYDRPPRQDRTRTNNTPNRQRNIRYQRI